MLFNVIRILLFFIFSVFIVIGIRKTKIVKKKIVSFLLVFLCIILISISGILPVENLIISFKSPESVFNYTHLGKINDIVYGEKSCMIVYSEGEDKSGNYIIPKSEKGYKIPNYFTVKNVSHKFSKDGCFDVYNVLETDDYYIFGSIISKDSTITIFDNNNKPIKNLVINMANTDTKTVFFYDFSKNISDEYYLIINNQKVTVF